MFDGGTQQEQIRQSGLRPAPAPVGAGREPVAAGTEEVDAGTDGRLDEVEIPEPPVTGEPAVDRVLEELRVALSRPLPDQVQAYEAVHRGLQGRLADVEE